MSGFPYVMRAGLRRIVFAAAGLLFLADGMAGTGAGAGDATANEEAAPPRGVAIGGPQASIRPITAGYTLVSTADHTKFEALQSPFQTGPEVTAACLTCHTEASKQIMRTSHWTWICPRARRELEEREHIAIGKAEHIINNFCIALPSNEPRCTSCHAGYGWKDKTFDFTNEHLVDCLVCHDQTGQYKKFPTAAGHPVYAKDYPQGREFPKGSGKIWKPVDLTHIAQHVGPPRRQNCGTCHFFGGGGEGVKHGDMDVTLAEPDRLLDVHMAADGPNFRCTVCHTTREHQVAGRCFIIPAYEAREYRLRGLETNLLACEACHGHAPHPDGGEKLNDHTDKVSCEACHIPTLARRKATKMWWDWSKAGRKAEDGGELTRRDPQLGELTYATKKGEFIWAKDAVPEYIWFDGGMEHTFFGDKVDDETPFAETGRPLPERYHRIDPTQPVHPINWVGAEYDTPNARIRPVKIHRGVQPYDPVEKVLVLPKLFPAGPDASEAYWKSYDWDRAITAGMAYAGLPYSGRYGWIQTEMIWPLKHMVAPAEQAVACTECHTAGGGRLAALTGFYMPGRDRSTALDWVGLLVVAGTVVLTGLHAILRMVSRKG